MAGSYISNAEGIDGTSGTSLATSTSLTTAAGDSLMALVFYDGGDATVSLSTDFGTWTENTSLSITIGSPRIRYFYLNSAAAATAAVTATYSVARTDRKILVFQARGLAAYQGGTLPTPASTGSGDDLITTGNYNVTNQPNYVLACAMDLNGDGVSPPNGTTSVFTSRGTFFSAGPDGRVSDYRATANGNVAATFNSGYGSHVYAEALWAFTEAAAASGNPFYAYAQQ